MRLLGIMLTACVLVSITGCPDVIVPGDCLTESCTGDNCADKVEDGWCYVDDQCYLEGTTRPTDLCNWCEPSKSKTVLVGKCSANEVCSADGSCGAADAVSDVTTDTPDVPDVGVDTPSEADTGPGDVPPDVAPDVVPDVDCAVECTALDCGSSPAGCDCGSCATGLGCQNGQCVDLCTDIVCGGCETCFQGACVALADGTACSSDADPCTDDACAAGVCTHEPAAIAQTCDDDGLACTDDICAAGVCTHPTTTGCVIAGVCVDDGAQHPIDPCLGCNGSVDPNGWSAANESAPCDDDGNPCTVEACVAGSCVSSPLPDDCGSWVCGASPSGCIANCGTCPAGMGCTGLGTCQADCDGVTCSECQVCGPGGSCGPSPALPCTDDNNPCTEDVCGAGACQHQPTNGPCPDDGSACTDDLCAAGTCAHPPVSDGTPCASDSNSCTDDVCLAGVCSYPATTGGTCSDGVGCTTDTCNAGACDSPVDAGFCVISGACVPDAAPNSANPCEVCDSAQDSADWTTAPDDTNCGAGMACVAGACQAVEIDSACAGFEFTCLLTTAGAVRCWGANDRGQLGDNSILGKPAPVGVTGLNSGVSAISCGTRHACALMSSGDVMCWGANDSGQVGQETGAVDQLTPVLALNGASAIAVGGNHSCAMVSGGVQCWGSDFNEVLGNGMGPGGSPTPSAAVGLSSGVESLWAGSTLSCAILNGGAAKCWGWNNEGQIGNGANNVVYEPADVLVSDTMVQMAPSVRHTCTLTTDLTAGGVQCWGDNDHGTLGQGNSSSNSYSPVTVTVQAGATAIASAAYTTCVLNSVGAQCWGKNSEGQAGADPSTESCNAGPCISSANTVANLSGATKLWGSVSGYHFCALVGTGLKCWGNNSQGQLGTGSNGGIEYVPVDVVVD